MAVGRGVLVGNVVAVGIRVFVAVGSPGVGVTPPAVGIKLGKVGVTVGGIVEGGVGVGAERRIASPGKSRITASPIKTRTTNPTRILITTACERVNNIFFS